MPDYFLAAHFAAKLGLRQEELADFEAKRVIRRVVKNERAYYSSRDLYRLKAVLHLVQDKGLSLENARSRVDGAARLGTVSGQ
jgi:DNA-binding transcriptional MerR regulator